jgi:hypothetical protein
MILVLRILSVLTLTLAAGILTLTIQSRPRDAASIDGTEAPSALERFRQTRERNPDGNVPEVPPLIQQAEIFAAYLKPVAVPVAAAKQTPATMPAPTKPTVATATPEVKPASSSPKFELHGISYYRQKPEQSMALVVEPGGARRWVRPGDQLGHLTVERIDCNSVVCRDGTQTQVVALAANEAITKYARSIKSTGAVSAPRQAQNKVQGPEVPPPAPGIRQMPLSRVAALLGPS